MPPTPPRPRLARLWKSSAVVAALLLAGLVGREVWRAATSAQVASPPIDTRFAAFLPFLRGEHEVGFASVSDDPDLAVTRRVEIQYALAPIVVVTGVAGHHFVVGWADRPGRIDPLAVAYRMQPLARTPDGFALFERSGP